jgi:hypothetical protein
MKKMILFAAPIVAAAFIVGCGGMAENKPVAANTNAATTNTNAAKPPTAAAPTKDALMALEKSAWEAWKTKDTKFWDGYLSDKFVGFGPNGRIDKAGSIKLNEDSKMEVKSYALSDDQMQMLGADAAMLTFKATQDYTNNGKPGPKEVWSASIYVRDGDKWKEAYYNEAPVADPKAPPAKPAKPATDTKPAADAKPADPGTEALLTVEKKGWDAWKARDQKAIEPLLTNDLSSLDASGRYDKAGTLKLWFDTKCEIKSYSLTNPWSASMTKDMSILLFDAATDGSCGGQPIGSTHATSVYVKDGDAWKLAFTLNVPV